MELFFGGIQSSPLIVQSIHDSQWSDFVKSTHPQEFVNAVGQDDITTKVHGFIAIVN